MAIETAPEVRPSEVQRRIGLSPKGMRQYRASFPYRKALEAHARTLAASTGEVVGYFSPGGALLVAARPEVLR